MMQHVAAETVLFQSLIFIYTRRYSLSNINKVVS